jgi:hypothetical protein
MREITSMAFWLILIMIVVVYYKGTTATIGSFSSAIQGIIKNLQGRGTNGFEDYPQ